MATYAGADTDARLAVLDKLAAELGATPNQLVIAWLLHQTSPKVIPLIGPRLLEHYEAAVPALDITLTAEQLAELDSAGV
jgi:aryl-alcohol dehydrogenase-like predicted oxidoreductase